MKRLLFALSLGAAFALVPAGASADYLYSVFRSGCTPNYDLRYSAADPVVATVHQHKSEIGRVASNFLTYGSFMVDSGSFGAGGNLRKARGKLYGLRLFKEKEENSNQWVFMPFPSDVLDECNKDKTCLFEAGSLLKQQLEAGKERRIYTGEASAALAPHPDNAGAYTVPIARSVLLPPSTLRDSGWHAIEHDKIQEWLTDQTGVRRLRRAWLAYQGLDKIDEGMGDLPMEIGLTSSDLKITGDGTSSQLRRFNKMLHWLHGDSAYRSWPLGDIYHASVAVVEAPQRQYLDTGYPEFKRFFRKRPEMIYVGANDGMIHAFHAGPDLHYEEHGCSTPRWQAGEEAWAYLPMNMLAKTAVAVENKHERFYSQDLSCRFTDVLVNNDGEVCTEEKLGKDFCGWRSVLVCGQGWGGSWYVTLDVTDPMAPYRKSDGSFSCSANPGQPGFRPMWEFTHFPSSTGSTVAMGKSWSLPSIGLVNFDGKPKWLGIMGSGYNTDMINCPAGKSKGNSFECETRKEVTRSNGTKYTIPQRSVRAFRALNLDYDGDYPVHGDGIDSSGNLDRGQAWVMDLANGEVIKYFSASALGNRKAIVADVPAVDSDFNGLIDAAYLPFWDGRLGRVHFVETAKNVGDGAPIRGLPELTTSSSIGYTGCTNNLVDTTEKRVLTSHPTAFGVPPMASDSWRNRVMVIQGAGINSGDDPDQQRNNGNFWEIFARYFTDDGSDTCPVPLQLCSQSDWNANVSGGESPRLLGAPIFSRQPNGEDWIVYTSWSPPKQGGSASCVDEGTARLWCLDVTNPGACVACNGFSGKGKDYSIILYGGTQPPSAPVYADGNIYVSGKDGPQQEGIITQGGQGPNANTEAPKPPLPARILSWREVF